MTASISAASNQNYLMKDYYHKDIERPGIWLGSGAKQLGLQGEIGKDKMGHLWAGRSPDGKANLVQNAGAKNRQAGWDITFSAPKSVSVAWGVGDEKTKAELEQAHSLAVQDAIQYLEDTAAFTRRGKDGAAQEQVGLVVGSFQHGTNRENECQLHTHNLFFNVGTREDGTTGTLVSRELYDAKMAAGAVYRARLATESMRLGYEIERTEKGGFELSGISKDAMAANSTRSNQIKGYLKEHDLEDTAKNRARAAVETRSEKRHVPEGELRATWRNEAKRHGETPESIRGLQQDRKELTELEIARAKKEVLSQALEKCLYHDSVFKERDLDRAIAETALGRGLSYSEMKAVKDKFLTSRDAVELEAGKTGRLFTTMGQLDLEAELQDCTQARNLDQSFRVESKHLFSAIKDRPTMSKEQQVALRHVTQAEGVKVVSGMAGTGKTYFLEAARETWEKSGFQVQGLALSGKAADGLQQGAKIESRTIDSFFASLDKKKEAGADPQVQKTIFLVDEAGMVDTRRMTRLFQEAEEQWAKVVLVGDAKQLQSVESGGAFQAVSRQVGEVELKEIRRQKEAWQKQVVHDFANGRADRALDDLDSRGQLVIKPNKKELRATLIEDWEKSGGVKGAKDHLILAQSNREVNELNRLAQAKRKDAGELGNHRIRIGAASFFEGDRILFRENKREQWKNGQMGSLAKIDAINKTISVAFDDGRMVTFSKDQYSHASLGYAATVHKAQGMTVQNAYVMAEGRWDRHLAYVAGSRAKDSTKIYAAKDEEEKSREAVKQGLGARMSRDNQKQLASDRLSREARLVKEPMRVGQKL